MSNQNNGNNGGHACPICFETMAFPVITMCGHSFCAECILNYWRTKGVANPVVCPLDRISVSALAPNYALAAAILAESHREGEEHRPVADNPQWKEDLREYNNKFRGGGSFSFSQIRETIAIFRREYNGNWSFKVKALVAIIASLLYLLSPLDLIPDCIPVVGLMDDLLVIFAAIGFLYSLVKAFKEQFLRWR